MGTRVIPVANKEAGGGHLPTMPGLIVLLAVATLFFGGVLLFNPTMRQFVLISIAGAVLTCVGMIAAAAMATKRRKASWFTAFNLALLGGAVLASAAIIGMVGFAVFKFHEETRFVPQ